MFFKGQFGFRPKHSTDYAILSIIDKVQKAVDDCELSCGLFLDFSKAFDTVDHDILIDQRKYYGIRGIGKAWFTSYLKNRKQMVTVNGATSDLVTVPCGILQGSVLGPILFLLYINDFHKCSSRCPVVSIQSRFDTSRFDTNRSRFDTHVKSFRYTSKVDSIQAEDDSIQTETLLLFYLCY